MANHTSTPNLGIPTRFCEYPVESERAKLPKDCTLE